MDEYIKKSEAVDVIVKYPYDIAGKTATAIKMIEDLPSADVIEVVRCKDCYYSEKMPGVLGECLYCNHWDRNVDDDTYCSNGERRE